MEGKLVLWLGYQTQCVPSSLVPYVKGSTPGGGSCRDLFLDDSVPLDIGIRLQW